MKKQKSYQKVHPELVTPFIQDQQAKCIREQERSYDFPNLRFFSVHE